MVFKKPVDAIVSVFGSLESAPPEINKAHFLKFCYSLRRGGIMLVGFNPTRALDSGAITMPRKPVNNFIQALKKQGFKATVSFNSSEWKYDRKTNQYVPLYRDRQIMPPYAMIVERL